jgi:hypothetical protein
LAGPWSSGVDARRASVTRHQTLSAQPDEILLEGDGHALVIERSLGGARGAFAGGELLVVANGSFLLNEPLARPARRPLAKQVLDWAGEDEPRHIAFVETRTPVENGQIGAGSVWGPLMIEPTGIVLAHWLAFLLLLSLSAAAILGRPRHEPSAGSDRPVAHAEALGDLLRKVGDVDSARELLDAYRRWRHPVADGARRRGAGHGSAELVR